MSDRSNIYEKYSDGTPTSEVDTPNNANTNPEQIGFPGLSPFTRGIQPTMYRGRLWTMRQYAGFASAEETNKRFHHLLNQGQTGLSIAFDLPTQMGYDADDRMAKGEVGRVGVSISSVDDMELLLKNIPLDKVSTSMTINATAAILLAFYIVVAKRRGIELKKIRGTVQNDILKEYIARGTYIFPPTPSLRLTGDVIAFCSQELPGWNPISVSGYHIREAGSDSVQEIAFTISNACTYAQTVVDRGIPFDHFAPQFSFFFAAHNGFLEEIAKFRAARRLWAKLARDRFGAKEKRSQFLRFHVQTGGSTLTAQQTDNNLVRVTLQAMAAVLGGCQSLHTNSRDEALTLPTQLSATLALRTQQILAEESGIANTVDPTAGSFTIEKLTDQIEEKATALLGEVDNMGGSVTAVEKGFFERAISHRAFEYQKEIEGLKRKIVGVNVHQSAQESTPTILRVNPDLEKTQIAQLKAKKEKRNSKTIEKTLAELKSAAGSNDNLMPLILNAVESNATLGEISHTLRSVFGTYQPKANLE